MNLFICAVILNLKFSSSCHNLLVDSPKETLYLAIQKIYKKQAEQIQEVQSENTTIKKYFSGVIHSRKLSRLLDDTERKRFLI